MPNAYKFPPSDNAAQELQTYKDNISLQPIKVRENWKTFTFYTIVSFCLLLPLALNRLIAKDEGFYLIASKLVSHGKIPYQDFFYPQTPLLPYIYAAWFRLTTWTWESARVFTAFLTAVTSGMMALQVKKKHSFRWGMLALILFTGCNFVFSWFLSAQTYSLSISLLFGTYFLLTCGESYNNSRRSQFLVIFAGAFFGLSIGTRLFFAGLGPLLLFALWFRLEGAKKMLQFCIGSIITLSLQIPFLILDYNRFYFNNLGYHLIRSSNSFAYNLERKWNVFRATFGLKETIKQDSIQFPLLTLFSIFAVWYCCRKKRLPDLALLFVVGLGILNCIPTPNYVQYFCTLTPFLVILAVDGIHTFLELLSSTRVRALALTLFLATYFLYVPRDIYRYTWSGEGVMGIGKRENAENWSLVAVKNISKKIEETTLGVKPAMADWPGHLFETSLLPASGFENHFGIWIARSMSPEQKKYYRVRSRRDIAPALGTGELGVLVLSSMPTRGKLANAVKEAGTWETHLHNNFLVFTDKRDSSPYIRAAENQ